ncbi:AAA family ATPase [Undibacterium arcticum]
MFCTSQGHQKNLLTATGGGPYNSYNSARFKQTTDHLCSGTPVALLTAEERQRHLVTKEGIAKDTVNRPIADYPDFVALTSRVQEVLDRSVVASTIDDLISSPAIANWVGQGLLLHRGEHSNSHCQFCTQPLPPERLQRLEAHFNDEFNRFQSEVATLIADVTATQNFVRNINVPNKGLLYSHLISDYEEAETALRSQSFVVGAYLDALRAALEAKKRTALSAR